MENRRDEFLLEMYKQVSNHLNRHILGNWQFIGVLAGAVGFLTLVDKQVLTLDFAASIVVAICSWLIANTLDANSWFNRNINIISNIERQFLDLNDIEEIHPYFNTHRKAGDIIAFFKIQLGLGIALSLLVLIYHFYIEVWPYLSFCNPLQISKFLPYITALISLFLCVKLQKNYKNGDDYFEKNSPGKSLTKVQE